LILEKRKRSQTVNIAAKLVKTNILCAIYVQN